jgi:hypothetical protein
MRILLSIFVSLFVTGSFIRCQDSTSTHEISGSAKAALYAMTGVFVPLAIAGTIVSFLPPNIGMVEKEGSSYGTFGIESGVGFGEKRETGIFTDYRFSFGYTHIYNSNERDLFRFEMKKDFHFDFVDRRKIFLSGFHFSAGLLSDFPNHGYTVGTGVWLETPWLAFFGFFPSHTYGITYRYNKYFNGNGIHEISLGMTSAITF